MSKNIPVVLTSALPKPIQPIFYVYIYLDQRKPGNYVYGEFIFAYEPMYGGFGHGRRIYDHLTPSHLRTDGNRLKCNKILKIREETGQNPIHFIYKENMTQKEALDFETHMITTIGRLNIETGPLTNLTNGGEANSGRVISEKDRKNRSERLKGKPKPPITEATRARMRKNHADVKGENNPNWHKHIWEGKVHPRLGKHLPEESKKKIGDANRGRHPNDKTRKKISIACAGEKNGFYDKHHNNESKKIMSEKHTKYVYTIESPKHVLYKNVISLLPFAKQHIPNYKRFRFNGGNMKMYRGWKFTRILKEDLR